MSLHRRLSAAIVLLAVAGAAHAAGLDAKTAEVVTRSEHPQQTFTVYEHFHVRAPDGSERDAWLSEFGRWPFRRVEMPEVNSVANCETGMVQTAMGGQRLEPTESSSIWCGVPIPTPYDTGEWLGEVDTKFGKADRIRIVTIWRSKPDHSTTYDVLKNGVMVAVEERRGPPDGIVTSTRTAAALLPQLPAEDLFEDASVAKSFTPEAYQFTSEP